MKNNNSVHACSYAPQKEDVFLLDTNILLRLFTPYFSFSSKEGDYVDLWGKIKKKGARRIITSIQISEFINRCIRMEFELYKKEKNLPELDYKSEYRASEEYKEKMDEILNIVKTDIQREFEFIDDQFSKMNYESIFIREFSYDFNDALLIEIVNMNKAIFVSQDSDFINYKVPNKLVTCNNLLLNRSY